MPFSLKSDIVSMRKICSLGTCFISTYLTWNLTKVVSNFAKRRKEMIIYFLFDQNGQIGVRLLCILFFSIKRGIASFVYAESRAVVRNSRGTHKGRESLFGNSQETKERS